MTTYKTEEYEGIGNEVLLERLSRKKEKKVDRLSVPWEIGLYKRLQDREYAAGYILECVKIGVPLEDALEDVIRAWGIKDFAEKVKMSSPEIIRLMHPASNPTKRTLTKIFEPFGLELSIRKIRRKRKNLKDQRHHLKKQKGSTRKRA